MEYDRIYIEIEIVDLDSSLESESDSNRRSNLDRDFNLTTTIRFGTCVQWMYEIRINLKTGRSGVYISDIKNSLGRFQNRCKDGLILQ